MFGKYSAHPIKKSWVFYYPDLSDKITRYSSLKIRATRLWRQ